jgi:penicillin-binding protein 1A
MKKFNKLAIILSFLIISFSSVVGFGFFLIYKAYSDLPDITKLIEEYDPIIPTIIYDINGEIIDKFYKENREIAKINEIPIEVQNAFLAIEDKNFRTHYGFDPLRVIKSIIMAPKYILAKRNVPGGSTITQQLVKNAFLTNERRIMRKIKEALIAIEIEKHYTKAEILEKYLNEIYFGEGAYGIKTSAHVFLGKELYDLNLAEAALLAGVPNRPAKYSPIRHLDNALKRKNLILNQMLKFGFITKEQYDDAKKVKFILEDKATDEDKENPYVSIILKNQKSRRGLIAPDFVDLVDNKIFEMFESKEIYEGGMKIYTTLDLRMQKIAEDVFANSDIFKNNPDLDGALITIDSNTGYVKAVIGGKNYKSKNFNRAFQALRQPGSSFKPFLYYTALKYNYQMNLVVEDSPLEFGDWKPENYSGTFEGNITILEAMERSRNIPAINLLQKVGIKNLITEARRFGITSEIPYNLTIALGSLSLSPFELAKAYIPFSNGGYKVKPIFITKVTNRYGKVLFENNIEKEKIVDNTALAMLVHMMKDVVENGSGKAARVKYLNPKTNKREYIDQAGKTGTTNGFRSAWFSGYTPDFVTTLYLGRDNNTPMGRWMTGGGAAAPIWGQYVQRLIDEGIYTPTKFEFLDNLVKEKELKYIDIDSRNGLLSDKSSYSIRTALFKTGYEPVEYSNKYKNGLDKFFPKSLEEDNIKNSTNNNIHIDNEIKNSDEESIDTVINNLNIFD